MMESKNNIGDLICGRYRLKMSGTEFRPLVMGVLNVTPDSFSDGGVYASLDLAITHAENMIAEGVDIIDIGGESTRPGSPPVSVEEELSTPGCPPALASSEQTSERADEVLKEPGRGGLSSERASQRQGLEGARGGGRASRHGVARSRLHDQP
jgi:hypothetical protein